MAAPVTFPGGHVYELIVTSASLASPARQWRNVQAIYQTASAPADDSAVVEDFWTALARLQFDDSQVVSAELRAWTRGDIPFDEQGYIWKVEGLNIPGSAATNFSFGTTHPCDGDIALLFHKQQTAAGGRVGKLYLHNAVRQEFLTMQVGAKPVLTAPTYTALPSLYATDFNTHVLEAALGPSADPGYITVHWSKKTAGTPFKTAIDSFVGVGVTEHDLGRHNI
jgi:hypothetical protein